MHRLSGFFLCLACLFASHKPLYAQPIEVKTLFSSAIDRYQWRGEFRFAHLWKNYTFQVQNAFISDAFGTDKLYFQDENRLRWRLNKRTLSLQGYSYYFGQQQGHVHVIQGGYRAHWREHLSMSSSVGVALDTRPGASLSPSAPPPLHTDIGPTLSLQTLWKVPSWNTYSVQLNASGEWHWISPRKSAQWHFEALINQQSAQNHLTFQLQHAHIRRDTYQALSFLNRTGSDIRSSEIIESNQTDSLTGVTRFQSLLGPFQLLAQAYYQGIWRRFRTLRAPANAVFYNTDLNRQMLTTEIHLSTGQHRKYWELTLRKESGFEKRKLANVAQLPPVQATLKQELLQQASFVRGLLEITSTLRWPLSSKLLWRSYLHTQIQRYDTPETNPDDRDEALYRIDTGLQYMPFSSLKILLQTSASLYHTVFLKAARSAENNKQYALRFYSSLYWQPLPQTRIEWHPEIRTTYTVEDFSLPARASRNQSARELRYRGKLEHHLQEDWYIRFEGHWSRLLLGRLNWKHFSEIPSDTLHTYGGWLRTGMGKKSAVEMGWRTFIRQETRRAISVTYPLASGEAQLTRPGRWWIIQLGPTCTLRWEVGNRKFISLEGWLQRQYQRAELWGQLPEADQPAIEKALRQGKRQWIPYLTLHTQWVF